MIKTDTLRPASPTPSPTCAAVLAATLLICLAVGYIASRWTMARVTRINPLADRVAAGNLSARLPDPRSNDEFGLLESHIHRMLDRIKSLNRTTHNLSDTIAHELRSPLTRIQSRLAKLDIPDAEAPPCKTFATPSASLTACCKSLGPRLAGPMPLTCARST